MIKKKILVSIIIPAYNEAKTIIKIINKISKLKVKNFKFEVVVVDDGSKDKTLYLLKKNKKKINKLISNKKNLGKGASIKKGIKQSSGKYIFFQDADLEYDPKNFLQFSNILYNFDPDIVIGSRFNYLNYTRSYNLLNKVGNQVITFLFNILNNTTFTDIYCGHSCIKREIINPDKLKTYGWEQHAEILGNCVKKGEKFYEVPINFNGRTHKEGKKIRWYHIFKVIITMLLVRLR